MEFDTKKVAANLAAQKYSNDLEELINLALVQAMRAGRVMDIPECCNSYETRRGYGSDVIDEISSGLAIGAGIAVGEALLDSLLGGNGDDGS